MLGLPKVNNTSRLFGIVLSLSVLAAERSFAAPNLFEPKGTVSDGKVTFRWSATGGATQYLWRVRSASGSPIGATKRDSSSFGCGGGGTCQWSFDLGSGSYSWDVLPFNGNTSQDRSDASFVVGSGSGGSTGGSGGSTGGGSGSSGGSTSEPLISPIGSTNDNRPTFRWKAFGNSTEYLLRLYNGQGNPISATKRSASNFGCGDGNCEFSFGNVADGNYRWNVRPVVNGNFGSATDFAAFSISGSGGGGSGGGGSADGGSDGGGGGTGSGTNDGDSFKPNHRVVTVDRVAVRSAASFGSGVNGYASDAGLGTITNGPNANGGSRWWQVRFEGGPTGWVPENQLDHPYFPGQGSWRSLVSLNGTPGSAQKTEIRNKAGIDWDRMNAAFNYSRGFASDSSVVVIRNGHLAFHRGNNNRFLIASATKSITGLTLMGACARYSDLCPEEKLYPNMPGNWGNDDSRKGSIDIRHVMAMTSGLQPHDQPGANNYLNIILNRDMRTNPTNEWSYASLPIEMLSIIMQERSGRRTSQLFVQYFGNELGISSVPWGRVGQYDTGSSKSEFRATDLAKVLYLVMMEGAWKSGAGQKQLLSASRARDLCSRPSFLSGTNYFQTPGSPFPVDNDSQRYYGLTWWLNTTGKALGTAVPRDACYAHGFKETLAIAVPSENMVVIRFGSEPKANAAFKREFMKRVMNAVL